MVEEGRKRRPRGEAALGNIDRTKIVVAEMISHDIEERRKKTKALRPHRIQANQAADDSSKAEG